MDENVLDPFDYGLNFQPLLSALFSCKRGKLVNALIYWHFENINYSNKRFISIISQLFPLLSPQNILNRCLSTISTKPSEREFYHFTKHFAKCSGKVRHKTYLQVVGVKRSRIWPNFLPRQNPWCQIKTKNRRMKISAQHARCRNDYQSYCRFHQCSKSTTGRDLGCPVQCVPTSGSILRANPSLCIRVYPLCDLTRENEINPIVHPNLHSLRKTKKLFHNPSVLNNQLMLSIMHKLFGCGKKSLTKTIEFTKSIVVQCFKFELSFKNSVTNQNENGYSLVGKAANHHKRMWFNRVWLIISCIWRKQEPDQIWFDRWLLHITEKKII